METGVEEGTVVPTLAKQMGNQFGRFGLIGLAAKSPRRPKCAGCSSAALQELQSCCITSLGTASHQGAGFKLGSIISWKMEVVVR